MKPTDESILFDLDNTIYDQTQSWNMGMEPYYPDIKMVTHPMSVTLMAYKKTLPACASLHRVFDVGYHLDEQILSDSVANIRLLASQRDVWFVSMAAGMYHAPTSYYEKRVQLLRDFGGLSRKAIFSGDKYEIPGKFMVDDHPELRKQQERAKWRGVTVKQMYNINKECDLAVEVGDYYRIHQFE